MDGSKLTDLARNLRIILLDVDGVMTDGGIILMGSEGEAKRFHVQDGIGISLAQSVGLQVGIITSRVSTVVERRAKELKIDQLIQGASKKLEALEGLLSDLGFQAGQCAYLGDDIQDLPVLQSVGMPIAVQNAVAEVKVNSLFITQKCGGDGAVREAVEWLLELRGDLTSARDKVSGL